jgi:hypothetical protein
MAEYRGDDQSGEIEASEFWERDLLRLPVFTFSYRVNEEYYSGRFGLIPTTEPRESLIKRMIDRNLIRSEKPTGSSLSLPAGFPASFSCLKAGKCSKMMEYV